MTEPDPTSADDLRPEIERLHTLVSRLTLAAIDTTTWGGDDETSVREVAAAEAAIREARDTADSMAAEPWHLMRRQRDEARARLRGMARKVVACRAELHQAVEDWGRNDEQVLADSAKLAEENERLRAELVAIGAQRDDAEEERTSMIRDLHAAQFDGATSLPDRPLDTVWAYLLDLVRKDRSRLSGGNTPADAEAQVDPRLLRWCEWPGCLHSFDSTTGPGVTGWVYVRTGAQILLCPDHVDAGHRPQRYVWQAGDTTISTSCECGAKGEGLTPANNDSCITWWREHVAGWGSAVATPADTQAASNEPAHKMPPFVTPAVSSGNVRTWRKGDPEPIERGLILMDEDGVGWSRKPNGEWKSDEAWGVDNWSALVTYAEVLEEAPAPSAGGADTEDEMLVVGAQARVDRDAGERHGLDEVLAELHVDIETADAIVPVRDAVPPPQPVAVECKAHEGAMGVSCHLAAGHDGWHNAHHTMRTDGTESIGYPFDIQWPRNEYDRCAPPVPTERTDKP